ncbi:histone H3.v1-like [Lates calcarifer]|uniref:Histone H3.v1-like n=1 Tax=Lates calcarifer TaxID=8187 RepID=A0AAJ7VBD5_LATCA|nr:histone H3.v1-like [Lates calcarifer]
MSCSSCSCCCCESPSGELLQGIRKKEQLVREEEEEQEEEEEETGGGGRGGGEEEESRRNMDISLLREQYRSSRDRQRRHTQVLLFRRVSEELSDAISIIPVTQGLTSPPPAPTFDPDPSTFDPWHLHLGLHRRSCPGVSVQLPGSSPETNSSVHSSSRRPSSSSSESRGTSPCSSFNSTTEEDLRAGGSRADPPEDSQESSAPGSLTSSEGSSTPVASAAGSQEDLKESRSTDVKTSASVRRRGLRFTRQLSVGGVGSSSGVHHNQDFYPFPNRKTPRISEAARRLGMYSSF